MNRTLAALTAIGALAASPSSYANTINLDLSTAVLSGGDSLIAGGTRIKFDPNTVGETATFTLTSVPGTQYSFSVTGQCPSSEILRQEAA
jgi:hypothetical protein